MNKALFLDRDGVINHEKKADYILNWNEFKFYDGVLEALSILNNQFKTIVMVTNQKGVGKKLMSLNDLNFIHQNMMKEIENAGMISFIQDKNVAGTVFKVVYIGKFETRREAEDFLPIANTRFRIAGRVVEIN